MVRATFFVMITYCARKLGTCDQINELDEAWEALSVSLQVLCGRRLMNLEQGASHNSHGFHSEFLDGSEHPLVILVVLVLGDRPVLRLLVAARLLYGRSSAVKRIVQITHARLDDVNVIDHCFIWAVSIVVLDEAKSSVHRFSFDSRRLLPLEWPDIIGTPHKNDLLVVSTHAVIPDRLLINSAKLLLDRHHEVNEDSTMDV